MFHTDDKTAYYLLSVTLYSSLVHMSLTRLEERNHSHWMLYGQSYCLFKLSKMGIRKMLLTEEWYSWNFPFQFGEVTADVEKCNDNQHQRFGYFGKRKI